MIFDIFYHPSEIEKTHPGLLESFIQNNLPSLDHLYLWYESYQQSQLYCVLSRSHQWLVFLQAENIVTSFLGKTLKEKIILRGIRPDTFPQMNNLTPFERQARERFSLLKLKNELEKSFSLLLEKPVTLGIDHNQSENIPHTQSLKKFNDFTEYLFSLSEEEKVKASKQNHRWNNDPEEKLHEFNDMADLLSFGSFPDHIQNLFNKLGVDKWPSHRSKIYLGLKNAFPDVIVFSHLMANKKLLLIPIDNIFGVEPSSKKILRSELLLQKIFYQHQECVKMLVNYMYTPQLALKRLHSHRKLFSSSKNDQNYPEI